MGKVRVLMRAKGREAEMYKGHNVLNVPGEEDARRYGFDAGKDREDETVRPRTPLNGNFFRQACNGSVSAHGIEPDWASAAH